MSRPKARSGASRTSPALFSPRRFAPSRNRIAAGNDRTRMTRRWSPFGTLESTTIRGPAGKTHEPRSGSDAGPSKVTQDREYAESPPAPMRMESARTTPSGPPPRVKSSLASRARSARMSGSEYSHRKTFISGTATEGRSTRVQATVPVGKNGYGPDRSGLPKEMARLVRTPMALSRGVGSNPIPANRARPIGSGDCGRDGTRRTSMVRLPTETPPLSNVPNLATGHATGRRNTSASK
jgi:hypothetical protein